MKKMWKNNNKAVSPVIATILMVAITVVLAAVLYVMVMGFGGGGTTNAPTASMTVNGDKLVISLSQSYTPAQGVLSVILNTSGSKIPLAAFGLVTGSTSITLVDAGIDGKISTGDYFTNSAIATAHIDLVWTSGDTSQVIASGTI